MKTKIAALLVTALFAFPLTNALYGHCQIPCGIFDDEERFTLMLEDVTTIKKSITELNKESAKDNPNYNQLVRWVMNKETHADRISEKVHYYFLAQRIKPDQPHYQEKLVATHAIIIAAMKAKQGTDLALADDLEKAILEFKDLYHH